jgi:hypothetical protein
MSAADWHRVGDEWMGPGMMRASGHHGVLGWWAIPFLGLTAFLTAGVVWGLLTWRSGRRIPTA